MVREMDLRACIRFIFHKSYRDDKRRLLVAPYFFGAVRLKFIYRFLARCVSSV